MPQGVVPRRTDTVYATPIPMSAVQPFMMGGALGSRPTKGLSGFWYSQSPTIESVTSGKVIGTPSPVLPNAAKLGFNLQTPNFYGSGLGSLDQRPAKRARGGCDSGRGFYSPNQVGTVSAVQYMTGQPASQHFFRAPDGVGINASAHASGLDVGGAGTKAGAAKNPWLRHIRECAKSYKRRAPRQTSAKPRKERKERKQKVRFAAPPVASTAVVPFVTPSAPPPRRESKRSPEPVFEEAQPAEEEDFEPYIAESEPHVSFEYEPTGPSTALVPAPSSALTELKRGLAAAPAYRETPTAQPGRKRKAQEAAHEVRFSHEAPPVEGPFSVSLRKQHGEFESTKGESKRARVSLGDISSHFTKGQLNYINKGINALSPDEKQVFLAAAEHVWQLNAPKWLANRDPITDYDFEEFRVATVRELTSRGQLPLRKQGSGFKRRGGDFFGDLWSGIKKGADIVSTPFKILAKVPGINTVTAPISTGIELIRGAGISKPAFQPFPQPRAARLPGVRTMGGACPRSFTADMCAKRERCINKIKQRQEGQVVPYNPFAVCTSSIQRSARRLSQSLL